MKRLLSRLRSLLQRRPVHQSNFVLAAHERRDLIQEIQLETFRHLDMDDVRWVTSWALTLSERSDDCILRIWEEIHGGR